MKLFFKKTILFALVAALAVASLPFVSVSAAGVYDPSAPPQISHERLEKIWARQLRTYERMGRTDEFIEKAQQLIDRAKANGKDVSAVQVALDAFKVQVEEARIVYQSAQEIIGAHQGFDGNGKVTDLEKAKETIKAMGEKLKEIREAMDGTGKALKEAVKAFREANPRPQPTTTPEGG